MASPYNRVSGLWTDYFEAPESIEEPVEEDQRTKVSNSYFALGDNLPRRKLDRTIDKIGMGSYQWTLLSLCGLGWLADNCWIQATAIILPRVQQHYSVPDSSIGTLSFSMFFGMMFGAVGWGTCSDLMGRSTAFNATLFFTALFGILAALSPNFFWLCVSLFFLGSSVGGSMPTDGTLLLEHIPNGKQYLLTALSVFFSVGSLIAALVGIVVIPKHSCPPTTDPCDVEELNQGWKYLLIILGLLTLFMFFARVVFFRLHESPRYLVHAGRPQEAVLSLRKISKFNGDDLRISLGDVEDRRRSALIVAQSHDVEEGDLAPPRVNRVSHTAQSVNEATNPTINYRSTDSPLSTLDSASCEVYPPGGSRDDVIDEGSGELETDPLFSTPESKTSRLSNPARPRSRPSSDSFQVKWKVLQHFPSWVGRPLSAWLDRLAVVLSKEWKATTLLVWWIWFAIALAYTMFNVYLPKLLETRGNTNTEPPKSLEETMWDVVIFTLGGCPGALFGAYLIQSPLGRRLSLSFSTLITAAFCILFVAVERRWAITASAVGFNLSATTMWAVLYGMTPEIFATKVRGTACGTASALSRIGGMMAPLIGGALLVANNSFPVYASAVVFTAGGLCVLLLKVNEGSGGGGGMLH